MSERLPSLPQTYFGVSEAQVGRIEKRGYDACTLNTLRRYVQARGEGFTLEVRISAA